MNRLHRSFRRRLRAVFTLSMQVAAAAAMLSVASPAPAAETIVSLPRYPSVSPDGSLTCFTWRGDLWIAPTTGGNARRLTAHPAEELFSTFSPDGRQIAFTSNRNGYQNPYVINVDGTGLRQILNLDRPVSVSDWATDDQGRDALVIATRLEQANMPDMRTYTVPLAGGEPQRLFAAFGFVASVSPDGTKVLFNRGTSSWSRRNYRGSDNRDLWLYDRQAKAYTRLTTWKGNDGRAKWLDNRTFVFTSDRQDDCVNLYRLAIGQREEQAVQLTRYTDTDVEDFDVSADGKTLVFAMWDRLYRLDPSAERPAEPAAIDLRGDDDAADREQLRSVDRSVSETALSPDGKTLAVVAYGQVYIRGVESKSPTRRVTNGPARHRDVAWSADGEKLYFVSDADGMEAIHAATVTLTRSEVKKQVEAMARPAAADDAEQPATLPADDDAATQPAPEPPADDQASDPPATQPTTTAAGEKKDGRSAAADSRDDKKSRWPEAITFEFEPVIPSGDLPNTMPTPSPDGKWLAFRRGLGQLWIKNLASGAERQILDGWSQSLEWRWSPDSRRIAYVTEDPNNNADVWIVRVDREGEAPVNVSRHPDNDGTPRWSADGKILAFLSDRVNNESDVWMVFLDSSLENLTPAELDQYYKDAAAAAKKREPVKKPSATTRPATTGPATAPTSRAASRPATREADVKLDLDNAYLRLRRITNMPGGERGLELTPAGDRFIFTAQQGGTRGTFAVDKDGGEPKRLGAAVNLQHLSFDGDRIAVVESSRAAVMKLPAGEIEYLDVSDRVKIDLAAQSRQKFLEAARIVGQVYYDPEMNGLDWPAVSKRYLKLAEAAVTADEFDHVANRLLGELNGSHLGINTPEPTNALQQPMGRLGIHRKRVGNGYEVTEVFENGPAAKGPMKLAVGDVIVAVEGQPFGDTDLFEVALQGRVGRETLFTVRRPSAGGETREVQLLLTPISFEAEAALYYNHWRNQTARKVAEMSGGALGYIHIRGMDQGSLDTFERDLYAAADGKKGLIIDVRNNGGGWTADRLLGSILYPRHANTRPRGVSPDVTDAYPQDRLFIQRYTLPINMLCNENSFSNAEIVSHAFKTLRRGTLVGQQTAGGVISTGGTSLIDGTSVRLPFRGWYLPDGSNMELNGAMPDLLVPQTPESEAAEEDIQLKAAVDELLGRLK